MSLEILQNLKLLSNNKIRSINHRLRKVIQRYSFSYVSSEIDFEDNQRVYQKMKESSIIIIKEYKELNEKETDNQYFIIGFEQTLMVVKQKSIQFIHNLLSYKHDLMICFLENSKEQFDNHINIYYNEKVADQIFCEEISKFEEMFVISLRNSFFKAIIPCIAGYLINKGYMKTFEDRLQAYSKRIIRTYEPDEFIFLRMIGSTFISRCCLYYNIEEEQLMVNKTHFPHDEENQKLKKREIDNYENISHPLIPTFFGTIEKDGQQSIIIEFINGQTLKNYNKIDLNNDQKFINILELIDIFKYLHSKGYIYRDLKLDNIMIDRNKHIVLIDLDRMIKKDFVNDKNIVTADFGSKYTAPELKREEYIPTCKSDIYSIGKIISFIFGIDEQALNDFHEQMNFTQIKYNILYDIISQCTKEEPDQRPSIQILNHFLLLTIFVNYSQQLNKSNIDNLISNFFINLTISNHLILNVFIIALFYIYSGDIKNAIHYHPNGQYSISGIDQVIHYFSLAANQNHPEAQCLLGLIYYEGQYINRDINKSIHYFSLAANQNLPEAQFKLGLIYYEGQYINRNINKSIHYFSLAANQNLPEAQFKLGLIYYEGQYINCNIKKSIHYFSLAANQNYPQAQFYLGLIYYEGQYINRNINKSIHYYTLAANQNDPKAQFNLGLIYYEGQYINCNINKSIHYFSLAANQNDPKAQFNLGLLYYKGQYINRDIDKSIHYFSLAANQNHPDAQCILGLLYYEGQYIKRDINKSIHYISLAANQNCPKAQFNLGLIYYKGQYINRDINKSIHYYTLAANQNDPKAQFNLGLLYYEGQYIKRDINKSIHYISLAANQNLPDAQCILGLLYYEGQYINRNIDKSIHYFSLAANQNYSQAQFNLGAIYYNGEYKTRDINKAIHFFSLAANQNDPRAQFNLGLIYYKGKYVNCDIDKAIHYFSLASNYNFSKAQLVVGLINFVGFRRARNIKAGIWLLIRSSKNRCIQAFYAMGYLLHEGKYVSRDINAAIHYYKEGSSFNNQYSKNNLGIIFKNGFEDKIKPNLGLAAVYFEEAIKQKKDTVAMYNLGHLYLYNDQFKDNDKKSIDYLIQSFSEGFHKSLILLCLSLIKSYGYDKDKISQRLENVEMESFKLSLLVCQMIDQLKLYEKETYEKIYEYHRKIDYLYNFRLKPIESNEINKGKEKQTKNKNIVNISKEFYEGFGINLDDA